MRMSGFTNPMRGFERKFAPDYASRQFRDPGLRMMHSGTGGLGSLRHTMPHLRSALHFQTGGAGGVYSNPVGRLYASARPNLYNPDPMYRQVLAAMRGLGSQFTNSSFSQMPYSDIGLPYADGGEAPEEPPPPPSDLESPDQELSEPDQERKQIVVEAMLAIEGRHPDPDTAIQRFVEAFGKRALGELMQMVREQQSAQQEEGQEPDEDEGPEEDTGGFEASPDQEMTGAGGGLLRGRGTGQSDEIEGSTPSGRKVLLSDGEYVIDAPTVAALGDGSTSAGARRLDEMRKKIRHQAYGNDKQARPMKNGGRTIMVEFGGR